MREATTDNHSSLDKRKRYAILCCVKPKQRNTKDEMMLPQPLQAWLNDQQARCIRTEEIGKDGLDDLMHWYSINGQVFIIQEYADNNGVEVYLPASNNWEDAFHEIAVLCQL